MGFIADSKEEISQLLKENNFSQEELSKAISHLNDTEQAELKAQQEQQRRDARREKMGLYGSEVAQGTRDAGRILGSGAKYASRGAASAVSFTARSIGPLFTLLVVLAALALHVFDAWTGFVGLFNGFFILYALLGILIGLVVYVHSQGTFIDLFKLMIKWVALAVFLGMAFPRALIWVVDRFGSPFLQDSVIFALSLFPLFILTLIYNPEFDFAPALRNIANFWIGIFLIAILLASLGSFTLPIADTYQQADTGRAISNVFDRLWDGIKEIPASIGGTINRTTQLVNPSYYTGQVEDNKEVQNIGVRLEDVEPLDPFFTQGMRPVISGHIVANSFLDEKVEVVPLCRITSGSDAIGIPEQPSYEVFFGSDEYFECEFPDNLDPRRYPVEVSATFDFETWAYMPYEFVFDEKIRDYARLQQDIYRSLDIDRNPIATYTDGPVALSIGGSRNPIAVHTEEPYLRNAKIGFSVSSAWPRGDIEEVKALVLSIPSDFSIGECNREGVVEGPFPDENVVDAQGNSLYSVYEFRNAEGPVNAFTGITCDLELDSLDSLPELIGNDKATRTFVAQAEYSYTVTQDTAIQVRE